MLPPSIDIDSESNESMRESETDKLEDIAVYLLVLGFGNDSSKKREAWNRKRTTFFVGKQNACYFYQLQLGIWLLKLAK